MVNPTEHDEREYLEEIREKLLLAIKRVDDRVKQFSAELRQNKAYIYEHQSGMDEADMVAAGQSINRMAFSGESAVALKRKLMKLHLSPYFGRIDFSIAGAEATPLYIGIYTFTDEMSAKNLIYDWRAPISSMFYDFELGPAWYETPAGLTAGAKPLRGQAGPVAGELRLKRQYRIRDGRMEYMIENDINIHDEVLQKELSKAADDKMKTIVATIQRDQNAVIRNESSAVMIIQGVAGSGKTSIALHRIAFLLYRFRESIAAKDILILSPNKIFADYISNVLPELGEEQIPETEMDELAQDLLENRFRFQTFFQQVAFLLETHDHSYIERVRFKSDFEFLRKLNQYLIYLENNFFEAQEVRIGQTIVPSPFIHERFKAYHRIPLLKRIPVVIKDIQQFVRSSTERKITGQEKAQIREAVPRMIKVANVFEVYQNFYAWLGRTELFHLMPGNVLEYADVFPLIYCRIRMEGVASFDHVKHLLIDEMQDYTPVQYSVLSRIFRCKKTILGDITQVVNPYSGSSSEGIHQVFPQADVIKLLRSYRSTWEITRFTQRIFPNPDLIAMERHGPEPVVRGFDNDVEETGEIALLIEAFKASGHHSMAIITKTHRQSKLLFNKLRSAGAQLLTVDSTSFRGGVVVTTAHLAKGLEFDEVVVPFVSARNYHTDIDQRMLYIACTRAMHQLTVTWSGQFTPLIRDAFDSADQGLGDRK